MRAFKYAARGAAVVYPTICVKGNVARSNWLFCWQKNSTTQIYKKTNPATYNNISCKT